jgi:flavin-binding protein dodecin
MEAEVFKVIQLTGSSRKSMEEAIKVAIDIASKSLREMKWFEVVETRGSIENGKVGEWQVTIKLGFSIEDSIFPHEKK